MSQTTKQLAVRLPLDLHAQIVATAAENNRSGHAEMLYRLEQSFQDETGKLKALAVKAGLRALEDTVTKTVCDGLSALEERLLKRLAPEMFITEVRIDGDLDPEEMKRMFCGTGRLSESQPEISGLHTLGSAMPKQPFHHGGCLHTGLPTCETPTRPDRGETVIPCPRSKPLAGQDWVITGSLETMTRDRAREILMELGAVVVGSVNPATAGVVWGPGAGSKKTRAEQLGIQQYNERQLIELIRGHGVDMPLPKSNIQLLVTPGALEWDSPGDETSWRVHDGSSPVGRFISADTLVEVERRDGSQLPADRAADFCWNWDTSLSPSKDPAEIYAWRLAK